MKAQAKSGAARRRHRAGRGALSLITGLFVIAGLIRLGSGVGAAIDMSAHAAAQTAEHSAKPDATGHTDPKSCAKGPGLAMPLVAALKTREDRVAQAEAALADRRQALAVTENVVTEKLAALKAAEEKLARTIAIADGAAEKDVARLTEMYAAMKPKQASAVFEQMAPDFAAGFLGKMAPAAAAAILSGLSPQKAYTVSVILAGRNAAAPKD